MTVPKWRNWQTRYVQGVVGESPWEFESPLRHQRDGMTDAGKPADLDLAILAHLRGYPDELRRFSNLMKQGHLQGRAAADYFLSREVSADSFVAALARLTQGGEDVVTVVEAAELLDRPPAQVLLLAARPGFPAPLFGEDRHQIWRRADIMAWRDARAGQER